MNTTAQTFSNYLDQGWNETSKLSLIASFLDTEAPEVLSRLDTFLSEQANIENGECADFGEEKARTAILQNPSLKAFEVEVLEFGDLEDTNTATDSVTLYVAADDEAEAEQLAFALASDQFLRDDVPMESNQVSEVDINDLKQPSN